MFFTSINCFVLLSVFISTSSGSQLKFPDKFVFGSATSAYQIEGGWNEDGKGESNWDHFVHQNPSPIDDGSTGDIACDSYHKYKEDVKILKELGVNSYRFSVSWSRILPTGYLNNINELGIQYYNNLIDELLKNNIEPMITIFHWDMPWSLQLLGGFANPLMEEFFMDYARILFERFGDRVKKWLTFNEPKMLCTLGYGDITWTPAYNASGIADYLCGHVILKTHAQVYHMYQNEFKQNQKGRVGITLDTFWHEPASNSSEDIEAAERRMQFSFGWFANPIFDQNGDYPDVMKKFVENKSLQQGFKKSRLPAFTKDEIDYIRGTADFLGVNFYSTFLVQNVEEPTNKVGYEQDSQVKIYQDEKWPTSGAAWLKDTPWGFRKLLNWIKDNYDNPEIMITENGFGDKGEMHDEGRVTYIKGHLLAVLKAIHEDKVNLTAYYAWSLTDDFEWGSGYTLKFGLYHVDFNSVDRIRKPKLSAGVYKKIIDLKYVEEDDEIKT